MKWLVRVEEAALAVLAGFLFISLGYPWWWLVVLFVVPDASMVGYAAGPRVGAIVYNVVHHRGVAIAVILAGAVLGNPSVEAVGLLLFFHSSVDRMLGYGLKHFDSFGDTHLGPIGNVRERGSDA